MFDTAHWLSYEFNVHSPDVFWHSVPGIYIFAGLDPEDPEGREWVAYYIGSTESLARRLPYHPKWLAAELYGATHIHARAEWFKNTRESLEQRLIQACQPCLNVQHRRHPLTFFTPFQPKSW